MTVARFVFGVEPQDEDIFALIINKYDSLKFSSAVKTEQLNEIHGNPKVVKRKVKTFSQKVGIGTKTHQAIKLQTEQRKTEISGIIRNNEKKIAAEL